ncbi:MAG: AMP-binding protein [Gammaproteobacteria bacterium]|nr:AMP-binding protein [Gammaproteobacteria bacterium]
MADLNPMILADLFYGRARTLPDFQILTFEGAGVRDDEVRTYSELWVNAQKLAQAMLDRGMNTGDRFAILLRNHPEFIEMMIAASILGCVFVPIDPRTRGAKLTFTLNNSGCRGVLCADYGIDYIEEIRDQVPSLEWLIMLETGEDGADTKAIDIRNCVAAADVLNVPEVTVERRLTDPNAPLEILYTSGTTGDPKGVTIANLRLASGALFGAGLQLQKGDKMYTGLSLTHGNAQSLTFFPAVGMDLPVVFSRKFTKSRLWDVTRKYGCTVFNLLGGMTTAIYSEPVKDNDADNPVRMVLSAGMPAVIWKKFEERFNLKVVELYAAVDGYGLFMNTGDGPVGSFGKMPQGSEFKVVDEEGNEVPHGEMGELIGRPLEGEVKVEYFENKDASEKKTLGGWVRTGDICHRDEEGWFYFDYRKGGGIRHNGDFVHPGFVEQVLAEHPDIDDVYVYGVPAKSGAPGEKDVVAAIVVTGDFTPESVFDLCRKELEANFVPSYLQVVDEIPKTASEKPQERFLVEQFAEDASGVYAAR